MMQDTSLEAYFAKTLPKLARCQKTVLDAYVRDYDYTNWEVAEKLGWSINRVTPRVLELRNHGLLSPALKRRCRVTGNTACSYRKSLAVREAERYG